MSVWSDRELSAVACVRRTYKQLVDGTLRVTIDIEPLNAADFLRLLPSVDMPCALVPLDLSKGGDADNRLDAPNDTNDATNDTNEVEVVSQTRNKGGPLSRDAARICQNETFMQYVNEEHPSATSAAEYVRRFCGVSSRAEIDHDMNARAKFSKLMVAFRAWRDRDAVPF